MHAGFANPEFAKDLPNEAVDEFRFGDGRVCMPLTDGSTFQSAAEVGQVWRLPEKCAEGEDDGGFVRIHCGVVDPNGAGVEIAIALDQTGLLTVTAPPPAAATG